MAFTEKPPMLRGTTQEQVNALRDYLFRMAQSLETAAGAESAAAASYTVGADGKRVYSTEKKGDAGSAVDLVRKNALELRDLIIKSARDLEGKIGEGDSYVMAYADSKVEEYNSLYVAQSEFGTFTETVQSTIEATAKGVVESYGYGSAIESVQSSLDLVQNYYTQIDGEIRRGIVLDPDTGQYVTGIAISQSLQFSGECGASDQNNPGDGYTYYYLSENQTFGLYTSKGWQFWIDGYKKGWFDSTDGMLHVANIIVESKLQIGDSWQIMSAADGSEFEILFVGE